ncbi:MAG: hypothetical protein HZB24_04560 [Desulfobacterales bacterium]|nr:hypothetical protein [Desulfobacterales bacterium]
MFVPIFEWTIGLNRDLWGEHGKKKDEANFAPGTGAGKALENHDRRG